jgi:hypothetical protein
MFNQYYYKNLPLQPATNSTPVMSGDYSFNSNRGAFQNMPQQFSSPMLQSANFNQHQQDSFSSGYSSANSSYAASPMFLPNQHPIVYQQAQTNASTPQSTVP